MQVRNLVDAERLAPARGTNPQESSQVSARQTYAFQLILAGPDPSEPAQLERLFEAGCGDATFGACDGVYIADFDRAAPTYSEALRSAIAAVEQAVPGLRVLRVAPEELVSASEIAARTGRSRESVRQLFEGTRGNGDFPRPATWVGSMRLWNWTEVAAWFDAEPRVEAMAPCDVQEITNALLKLRSICERTEGNAPTAIARKILALTDFHDRNWATETFGSSTTPTR